jgi:hypothetical protein
VFARFDGIKFMSLHIFLSCRRFHANITAFKSKLLSLPDAVWTKEHQAGHNAVMTGRNQNMDRFKPGVEGIVLLFSDNEGKQVYMFPHYETFRQELEPLLLEVGVVQSVGLFPMVWGLVHRTLMPSLMPYTCHSDRCWYGTVSWPSKLLQMV